MKQLTSVGIEGDHVVLRRRPGERAPDSMTHAEVDAAGSRFFRVLGAASCLFLVFAGLIVFTGLRRKARQAGPPPEN